MLHGVEGVRCWWRGEWQVAAHSGDTEHRTEHTVAAARQRTRGHRSAKGWPGMVRATAWWDGPGHPAGLEASKVRRRLSGKPTALGLRPRAPPDAPPHTPLQHGNNRPALTHHPISTASTTPAVTNFQRHRRLCTSVQLFRLAFPPHVTTPASATAPLPPLPSLPPHLLELLDCSVTPVQLQKARAAHSPSPRDTQPLPT